MLPERDSALFTLRRGPRVCTKQGVVVEDKVVTGWREARDGVTRKTQCSTSPETGRVDIKVKFANLGPEWSEEHTREREKLVRGMS